MMLTRVLGVDVSHWDSTITWPSVKAAGYSFVWAKATEGTFYYDDTFVQNEVNAKAAGVLVGAFHFPRWDLDPNITGASSADSEAAYFWSKASPYIKSGGAYLQPMLDVEDVTINGVTYDPDHFGFTTATYSQWVNEWCNDIVADGAALGLKIVPVLYCGHSMSVNFINSTVSQNWPLWRPEWPLTPPNPQTDGPVNSTSPWPTWQFWQYTDAADPPGSIGNMDADVLNGDANVLQDYVIGSTGRWPVGTTVQINASSGLNAWNTSTSNGTATVVANSTTGKILQGPVYANGYQRWQIQYSNGVTGWSAEDFLNTVAPGAASNFNVSGLVTSLPTNFTWTAATNASSYDVYLDGVLKANVTTNSWTHPTIAEGSHTWQVIARNGELSTSAAAVSFTYDVTGPSAAYGAQVPTPGASTFDFTVVYTDAAGIDVSSLGNDDVTVTGPNSFSAAAALISVDSSTNGSPRTATYRITAPGGTWDSNDSGAYTIMGAGLSVKDVAGENRPAGAIGTFNFNVSWAYMSGSTLVVTFDGTPTPIILDKSGSTITATRSTSTMNFAAASVARALSVLGTTSSDNLQLHAPIAPNISFSSAGGNDNVAVTGGAYTFGADLGPASPSVALSVDAGAAAVFNTDQHLRSLSIDGTVTITPGDSVAIVTNSLSLSGKLNLNDGAIAVDYATTSPIGTWNGLGYTGITNLLARGRNGGSWNGTNGIVTSMTAAQSPSTLATIGVAEASAALGLSGGQTTTWDGVTVDATTVLVRYSFTGDANLSGTINGDDYFAIDSGYANHATGYAGGDFNYDGRIDADDYFAIDSNYGKASAPLASAPPLSLAPNTANNVFATSTITSAYQRLIEADDPAL